MCILEVERVCLVVPFIKQRGSGNNSYWGHGHFVVHDLCAVGRGGKLRDREIFKNKRVKTRSESRKKKNNANRSSFQ